MKQLFKGKILMIGCGGVGTSTLPMLLSHLDMPLNQITVMDCEDKRDLISYALKQGVKFVQDEITREKMHEQLPLYVSAGDMIIDLAYDIDCCDILQWCHDHQVLYINTSVEVWDPYKDVALQHPTERTLYARHMNLRRMINGWTNKRGATAVLDHGANPGLVSHFAKQGLLDIATKIIATKKNDPRQAILENALATENFAVLAQITGTKVIHISERDTQIINQPKRVNEFVNTWSIDGFYEEGIAPAELGWGTHEKQLPEKAFLHKDGPCNQICLGQMGMDTKVRSWVPCGEIVGFVVRHGEAFTLSDHLTVWENGKAVYRPTVHYAYCPSDAALSSLHELRMRDHIMQETQRIVHDEIVDGNDQLGTLLMGHDFKSWWVGSILDIHQARRLVPEQNATTVQVGCAVLSAVLWMLRNPSEGVRVPDDLPHREILRDAKPYLGEFISKDVDWTPLKNYHPYFSGFGDRQMDSEDPWQFANFLI